MRWLNFFGLVMVVMGISSALSPAFAMYNGAPANSIPGVSEEVLYKSLGVVVVHEKGDGPNTLPLTCMGVLIHRNFVATSGHCLAKANSVEIHLFSEIGNQNPVVRAGADWLIHEKWSMAEAKSNGDTYSFHDLGIVMIKSAPSWNQPMQIASEYDTVKEYSDRPLYVISREVSDYLKALPTLRVMVIHSLHHFSGAASTIYGGWLAQPLDGSKYAVCKGDSGAPVVTVDQGKTVLVGNHTTSGGELITKKSGLDAIPCQNYEVHYNMTFDLAFIQEAMNLMNKRNNWHLSSANN